MVLAVEPRRRDPADSSGAGARGPVTGRHARLFAGSPEGADASAIWFSLVASCMLQGIDPAAYLRAVMPGLGKKTPSQVRELTPAKWAAARRAADAVV